MQKYIVANWKMNGEYTFIDQYFKEFSLLNNNVTKSNNIIFCPPTIYLQYMNQLLTNMKISCSIGAQDCSQYSGGAYTGDISAKMLQDNKVKYVIIGHSERRKQYNENSKILINKLSLAIEHKLTPIFCIGEKIQYDNIKKTKEILEEQLAILTKVNVSKILIAYEPVWAIGTGKSASIQHITNCCQIITEFLTKFNINACILYGGSVNHDVVASIFSIKGIDGILVGGASLNVKKFFDIINKNLINI